MRNSVKAFILCLGLLALPAALATSYRELSLTQMLDAAELAFSGTVSSTRVEMRDDVPWTVVTFDVARLMAGELDEGQIVLSFLGGERTAGGSLNVSLMPRFTSGEQVLVLAYAEEFYSPLVGFNQGLWRLRDGEYLDEAGRSLSLDGEGRLSRGDGTTLSPAEITDAVERELEARE